MKSKYTASALNGGLRQSNKSDLVAIGRALGLECSERERSADLAKRVLAAAECLRSDRDHLARYNAELSRRVR